MNFYDETIHIHSIKPDFLIDCIKHSVTLKFDRMPDNLWNRLASDKPLSWISENLDKIISATFSIKKHDLKDEIEKWDNIKHIQVGLELRDQNTTYILTIDIPADYLDYFLAAYSLKK